jgi:hypothetical protein
VNRSEELRSMPLNADRWVTFCGPRKTEPFGMTLQNDTVAARNCTTPGVPYGLKDRRRQKTAAPGPRS